MNRDMIMQMKSQMVPSVDTVNKLVKQIEKMERECEIKECLYPARKGWKDAAVVFVSILVLCILAISPVGRAVADTVRGWMTPKTVTETVEGEKEENVLTPKAEPKVTAKERGYVIYVNEEYFQSEIKDGVRVISATSGSKARMTIQRVENISPEMCLKKQKKGKKGRTYQKAESLKISLAYQGVYYTNGIEWNDKVTRIYCIDDGEGGCYLVKATNTIEEDEGFGSRFISMLNTFELE